MGHNPLYIKGLYHQRRLVMGLDILLRGLEKTPNILPRPIMFSHTHIIFLHKFTERKKKEKKGRTIRMR